MQNRQSTPEKQALLFDPYIEEQFVSNLGYCMLCVQDGRQNRPYDKWLSDALGIKPESFADSQPRELFRLMREVWTTEGSFDWALVRLRLLKRGEDNGGLLISLVNYAARNSTTAGSLPTLRREIEQLAKARQK